ncbi:hypothetical protein Tsubulata_036107 [Turnera subulata]|uniref:Uncharacterized protein n=1 Tax=Turnera subulata TaxID=218843 RepID=A0A9Q0JKG7_9ROSI|nr:hypothetical protein Tsubulata_036107 [Turnera subulata]
MGLIHDAVGVSFGFRYQKLNNSDGGEELGRRRRRRRRWMKGMNGRVMKGLRLCPRSRKFTLKALSVIVLQSRIAKAYADIIQRVKMDDIYSNLVFYTQWGLPVLPPLHPPPAVR